MVTVITKTIGPTGRDYATPVLFDADLANIPTSTDLVAENERIEAVIDAGEYRYFTVSSVLTADATRNLTMKAAVGSEHGGVAGQGVIIYNDTTATAAVFARQEHTVFDGLVTECRVGASGRSGFRNHQAGAMTFRNCMARDLVGTSNIGFTVDRASGPSGLVTIENCISRDNLNHFTQVGGTSEQVVLVNCTAIGGQRGVYQSGGTTADWTIINNLFLGATQNFIDTGTGTTVSGSNNFTGTGFTFPAALQGSPYPITATTSFSTPLGSGDYAVYMGATGALADVTGNDVWQQGVGPGSNSDVPTTDINGVARSGASCNPGAFEADGYVAPEVLTRTVGTSSRDYSTLSLAEADVATIAGNADLTLVNKRVVFDIYNDSEFTTGLSIIGATSDHERYVTYQAAAGEEHTGDPNTGVRVNTTSSGVPAITVGDSYVRLNRLVIKNLVGNYGHVALYLGQSTDLYGVQVDGCVIDAGTAADGYAATTLWAASVIDRGSAVHPIVIQNCVLWHGRIGGIVAGGISNAVTTHLHLTNNTFIGCRMAVRAYGSTLNVYDVEFVNNLNIAPYLWEADVDWQVGGSSAIVSTTNSSNNFGAATSAQTTKQWPGLGSPNPVTGTTDTNPGDGDWAIYDATTGQLVASPYNSVFAKGVGTASSTNVPQTDLLGVKRLDAQVANPGAYAGMAGTLTSAEDQSPASNPVIYLYDKTLGFLVGDRVDQQNSQPFRGKVARFALHNNSERDFSPRASAVFYYDATSLEGGEFLDLGNRALNGYGGTREASTAPFYREGGFEGGSYVAATGGYLVSNSTPSPGYSGQLSKPLEKDAVVQRRGQRAFLTSNEVSYLIDDRTKSFRPLGIPRPGTKVSCTPQGVGPIDGFVRYAYRYVTTDGTVGPVFELDPCDATGGVNVFLGAETFGIPSDPAFGLSFGECEGDKAASSNEVECFVVADQDNTNTPLLHREVSGPGLTLETAFRLPTLTTNTAGEESVISQGVFAPYTGDPATGVWMALNAPKTFPWIGRRHQECCFQFTFRYQEGATQQGRLQTLFTIGSQTQRYKTGSFGGNTHWNLHSLVVSIQPGAVQPTSLVVCRDAPSGSHHRDDDLFADGFDYNFVDGDDYTIFVHRGGTLYNGAAPGSVLAVSIFNHSKDGQPDGLGGYYDGWKLWPGDPNATQKLKTNFWPQSYSGAGSNHIMWGATRRQSGSITGKTRVRATVGGSFAFTYLGAFRNLTESDNTGGQRMYHGRMWRKDFPLQVLAARGLRRFGARSGPLSDSLEVDVAFCPDSSVDRISGGYDFPSDVRVEFRSNNTGVFDAMTVLTDAVNQTVFLAYGYDNTTVTTASTSKIPLWCAFSTRNEGSLIVGTGQYPAVEIAKRKWHAGSGVLTFDDFANTIDLNQWTWLTLYFEQVERPSATNVIDVWLERVFIDGNTGEWGDLYNADVTPEGPGGKASNAALTGTFTNMLFTVGGVPGIDTKFEVETAETRLWNGEVYTAQGGGNGTETFGPYLSSRIPPNDWEKLWHYLRFAPTDVNDPTNQTTMDQFGVFADANGKTQRSADSVVIYQGAEVIEGVQSESGGATYYVPFPTPPLSSIRGIQIFRSQVVPVAETFPNGEPNPNATIDAVKACRAAPLYFLSEIPDGTNFYFDSAEDTLLGAQLNLTEGLIPSNPGGVFEWDGYLGMWSTDRPRIHFSASPDSWESFPSDMVLDLPLKEYGPIEAATELASRDARQSRVLVLGKSWGVFLDGSPTNPRVNTLGGGVGASSSRCLVVEKGVAYAYNGTLWAISGDGAVEDIGLPVLDLLPPTSNARLSVSSSLGSLYVVNEGTGLTLRWHFARREWFVEDRNALSTTDINGLDYWVNLSGYPSVGSTRVYADDVGLDTAISYTVSSYDNGANTFTVADATGIEKGQRVAIVANEDPRVRKSAVVSSVAANVVSVEGDLGLEPTGTVPNGEPGGSSPVTYTYTVYVGIGYWGTMLDTGQFKVTGAVCHVDVGVTSGDRWYATFDAADFARDPADRSGLYVASSYPTRIADDGGVGVSSRWGLGNRQRIQRLLVWSPVPDGVGLSELELNYAEDR